MDFQAISLDELPVNDKPTGAYDPVPAGAYSASITSAEARPTKDGSGRLDTWETPDLGALIDKIGGKA